MSIYVFSYFPFGFEGRVWDLIVSVPDHCLSFYFTIRKHEYESITTITIQLGELLQSKLSSSKLLLLHTSIVHVF